MSTPVAAEAVRVSVPARPELVHVLRSVTTAVLGRLPLSLEDIDDLRLAVDEACAGLLSLPGEPRTFRMDVRTLPGRVELVVGADAAASWPPTGLEGTLSWRILGVLADDVRFELWDGSPPAIRIVKRMLGGAG
jgi:serine/threonine-protein kinase RsbW